MLSNKNSDKNGIVFVKYDPELPPTTNNTFQVASFSNLAETVLLSVTQ